VLKAEKAARLREEKLKQKLQKKEEASLKRADKKAAKDASRNPGAATPSYTSATAEAGDPEEDV